MGECSLPFRVVRSKRRKPPLPFWTQPSCSRPPLLAARGSIEKLINHSFVKCFFCEALDSINSHRFCFYVLSRRLKVMCALLWEAGCDFGSLIVLARETPRTDSRVAVNCIDRLNIRAFSMRGLLTIFFVSSWDKC